jgi:hypothetical protein
MPILTTFTEDSRQGYVQIEDGEFYELVLPKNVELVNTPDITKLLQDKYSVPLYVRCCKCGRVIRANRRFLGFFHSCRISSIVRRLRK